MDCNKENAIRAKYMAETKMQENDFFGARKFVLKAQQLFPDLENISQMLTVCEVHCAAGGTIRGEADWYEILQLEPASDESAIKKQYRKLVLLLHPDKNKFEGAETAFKLVGEAYRTLSDLEKRFLYDLERGANFRAVTPRPKAQPPGTFDSRVHPRSSKNNPNKSSSSAQSFWTICPYCRMQYLHYQDVLNKSLICPKCMKPFISQNMSDQSVPSSTNPGYPRNPTGIPQHKFHPQHKFQGPGAHVAGVKSNMTGRPSSSKSAGANIDIGRGSTEKGMKGVESHKEVKLKKVKLQGVNGREKVARTSTGKSRKRPAKIVIESSDSEGGGNLSKDVEGGGQNAATVGIRLPRRSPRKKQRGSYNEVGANDNGLTSSSKRLRRDGNHSEKASPAGYSNGISKKTTNTSFSVDEEDNEYKGTAPEESVPNGSREKERTTREGEEGFCTTAGSNKKPSIDADHLSYPEPEFFDFDKARNATRFEIDQIWAVYDDVDGMPRFYTRIRKVCGPDIKLRFTWLEHEPIGELQTEWSKKQLPVGCGNFRLGKSESIEEKLMFSHLMPLNSGLRRNTYGIYPRKGEVWALFKNWDISWSSTTDNGHRSYEYDVVEVLSDFLDGAPICVFPLVKINGFVSLFIQAVDKSVTPFEIQRSEMLRFSHRIPSYRMKGDENPGVLAGSLELDTAALPTNFEKTCTSISPESIEARVEGSGEVFCVASLSEEKLSIRNKMSATQLKENNGDEKKGGTSINLRTTQARVEPFPVTSAREENLSSIGIDMCSTRLKENNVDEKGKGASIKLESTELKQEGSCEEKLPSTGIKMSATSTRLEENNAEEVQRTINSYSGIGSNGVFKEPTSEAIEHVKTEALAVDEREKLHATEHCSPSRLPQIGPSYEYPGAEFHDFDEAKSRVKFQEGQFWALYHNVSKFPNFYCRIRKVEQKGFFGVHVEWLSPHYEGEEQLVEVPYGCGKFKCEPGPCIVNKTNAFSHIVHVESYSRQDYHDIYPRAGEVWAMYKNWDIGWLRSDLEKCEYDIVEIVGRIKNDFNVSVLKKVEGYRSVFMPERRWLAASTVLFGEYLRFSHQIPAFRLKDEGGDKLQGYWELDPAAVPEALLHMDASKRLA